MNINEQMNQLGQIGSVGYNPTESVVDQLVTRTKRSRAIRQGSAALVGSLGAVGLGLLGAQVFVNLTQDQDAANIPIRDLAFNNMTFEELEGKGYTGLGKSPEELAAAWAKVQEGATIVPAAPAPAVEPAPVEKPAATCTYEEKTKDGWIYYKSTETGCSWVKLEPVESTVPPGSIEFGGIIAPCKNYYDAATGTTVFAAYIDAGDSWKKIVKCEGGPTDYWSGSYHYIFNGPEGEGWHATLSGTSCTGFAGSYLGAPAQYSCNPNKSYWIITDTTNYKKFEPQCWYYHISTEIEYGGQVYIWNGSAWVVKPVPTPTVTPSPEPTP